MPQTALRFGVRHPFEAKDNIRGGIAYLHWLLRHFNGNVALVLAGYNAGEQAVERYQGIPPYVETQHYVRAIMANYPSSHHPIPPPVSS
jgi:soluble lytic murein transglycosylase-like protein